MGSFGVEKWPGLHILADLGICNPHISKMFWSVLLSTSINYAIWRFPKMGARPNHPFEIVKRPFWAVHILGNLHFFQEPSIDTNASVLAAFKASPARFQIATVGRTAADTGSRDMQRQETRCGKLVSSMVYKIHGFIHISQKDTGLQRMGWALHLLVETH